MKSFKPMLAAAATIEQLKPDASGLILCSPKLDGIRAVVLDGVLVSRNLKPIPNKDLQARFGRKKYSGLDGELIAGSPGAPDCFSKTTSVAMSEKSADSESVLFHVFDYFKEPEWKYEARLWQLEEKNFWRSDLQPVTNFYARTLQEVEAFEEACLLEGFEGLIVRNTHSTYKFGRSTLREGGMLKIKRFVDDEAIIVGFEEQVKNTNPAKKDALGRTERSSHKANMKPKGTLGAVLARVVTGKFAGSVIRIGTGFSDAQRADIWSDMPGWTGRCIKFKHFPVGTADAPRFATFAGERRD